MRLEMRKHCLKHALLNYYNINAKNHVTKQVLHLTIFAYKILRTRFGTSISHTLHSLLVLILAFPRLFEKKHCPLTFVPDSESILNIAAFKRIPICGKKEKKEVDM